MIGNDLVDLCAREASGKSGDARFVRRVFTAREAELIAGAANPDRALWTLWAAKEAAYKVARKLRPDAIFAHSRYEVTVDWRELQARAPASSPAPRGEVRVRAIDGLDGARFPVEWRLSSSFVHCVALDARSDFHSLRIAISERDAPAALPGLYEPSERERASVTEARSGESLAVRRLARALAAETGLGDVEIVRERNGAGFGPPRLYPRGGEAPISGWDITLSHDGAYAAAVLGTTGQVSDVDGA